MFGKKDELRDKDVLAALSTVIEPELHRDLVSLNMIRDIHIQGNNVGFTIVLTTPACPLRRPSNSSRCAWARRRVVRRPARRTKAAARC